MPDFEIAWGVAGTIAVLAAVLGVRVAGEASRTKAVREELEQLRRDGKSVRKHDAQREKALRLAEAERDKATSKLAQRDKRDAQTRSGARTEREVANEKIGGLEAQLAEVQARLDGSESQLGRTREEFAAATERAANAEARAEAALAEARAIAESTPPPADPEELRALRERSESAEQKLAERDDALARATAEVARLKEKARTQEILYTSVRSELSLKKDQVRQQREELERLQGLRVALIEPE